MVFGLPMWKEASDSSTQRLPEKQRAAGLRPPSLGRFIGCAGARNLS